MIKNSSKSLHLGSWKHIKIQLSIDQLIIAAMSPHNAVLTYQKSRLANSLPTSTLSSTMLLIGNYFCLSQDFFEIQIKWDQLCVMIPGNLAFVKITLPDMSFVPALVLVVHSTQFVAENSQNMSRKTKHASIFHSSWCETFPLYWYLLIWFSQPNVGKYEWGWCTPTHFITLILVPLHFQVS